MDTDNTAAPAPEPAPAPAPEPSPAPPAPAPEPVPAPAPAPTDPDSELPRDKQGRFRSPQERIAELTRARHESEREAAYWRGLAQGSGKAPSPAPADATTVEPQPDQFDDYAAYVKALAKFEAGKMVEATRREVQQQQRQQQVATTWQQRETAFKQTTADYTQVMQEAADLPIAPALGEALQDSELGPQLAYHMAKHPDVAERLNSLPERQMLKELGRLESSLSAPPAPAPAPAARTTTAPPPVRPVSQGAAGVPDLAKMPMDEYIKQRKAQGARWAR